MSLKNRFTIVNIFMILGCLFAGVDIVYDFATGVQNQNLPIMIILAFVFFVIGVVLRFTFVKCPHCGDNLIGQKSCPYQCPVCGTVATKKPD